jgi:excinuclease ABC subunit C
MTVSDLDSVPGLGDVRRKALLRHFGSVKRLKAATVEEIVEVPGIGRRTADAILVALGVQPAGEPAAQPEAASDLANTGERGTNLPAGNAAGANGAPQSP